MQDVRCYGKNQGDLVTDLSLAHLIATQTAMIGNRTFTTHKSPYPLSANVHYPTIRLPCYPSTLIYLNVPYGTQPVTTRNLEQSRPQTRDGLRFDSPSATPWSFWLERSSTISAINRHFYLRDLRSWDFRWDPMTLPRLIIGLDELSKDVTMIKY